MFLAITKIASTSLEVIPPGEDGRKRLKWSVEMPAPPDTLWKHGPVPCRLLVKRTSSLQQQRLAIANNKNSRKIKGAKTLTFVFGDVWFCGGQSNMRYEMRKIAPKWTIKGIIIYELAQSLL